ncbi:MAG TPA: TonB family protein [Bryobacteraceae bacterium]|nr:TonB family protein [Bryobacteraceae bacterium]
MFKALILIAAASASALGFTTVAGSIQDSLKTPVDGAEVTIWDAGTGKGLRTGSTAGRFSFSEDMEEGDYLIKVAKAGMGLLFGAIQLHGEGPHELNLVLVENASGFGEVVKAEEPSPVRSPPMDAPPQKPRKIQQSKLIHKVQPVYPASAKQARISGNVKVSALLRTDGTLDDMVVLSAPSADLALAALLGVREWRYSPTYFDGKAVEVKFTIDVNFTLR